MNMCVSLLVSKPVWEVEQYQFSVAENLVISGQDGMWHYNVLWP